MLYKRNVQIPYWTGFFHAIAITLYAIFVTLAYSALRASYILPDVHVVVRYVFDILIMVLSLGVTGWLLFYKPIQFLMHRRKKAAMVMFFSTMGWLFLIIVLLSITFIVTTQ